MVHYGRVFLELHIHLDLVQRYMAGALNHYLHLAFPSSLGQLAQGNQLFNLGCICGIFDCAGSQAVAKADADIVFFADIQQAIKMLVKGIFLPGLLIHSKRIAPPRLTIPQRRGLVVMLCTHFLVRPA